MSIEKIIFGAGCFWGVESTFCRIDGVRNTTCGYSGGDVAHPTYEMVCKGKTGHAEVVLVEYDTSAVSLDELLDVFWQCHDPTTKDRQGVDIGTQYRSTIYFFTPEQEAAAKLSCSRIQQSGRWQSPVVTEILPVNTFYPAEKYHQRYFEKRGIL
ncbi:peptide-methionine (S)-S-oxide reductase MsrA [Nitrosomonas aestuarii]|uniref:peptide-methionine (S)-S-oxide reductase MsrA n=1 Tax=Nitrosomonas aestuarii TaxID=52441 RepID=UPI000D4D1207|nr:peptide-methionine (S)-S-oxide reductase MsrA [Nitrosomonas aestuarii]PTN11382.1 peptide-methionine (S)-S-oxide reductase [Nitrosomonas aestuarii]